MHENKIYYFTSRNEMQNNTSSFTDIPKLNLKQKSSSFFSIMSKNT